MSLPTTKEGAAMRASVVYESMYGNTHRIAEAIARAFARRTRFRLSGRRRSGMSMSMAYDLIVVGGRRSARYESARHPGAAIRAPGEAPTS